MSFCHKGQPQKPVVHTLAAMQDDLPPPPPERYQLLGADCPSKHYVCSDLGPPVAEDEAYLDEDSVSSIPEQSDHVLPVETPIGTDLPNVGELRTIEALEDECRFNAAKLQKIRHLAEGYDHWRPIRGDGNCYYRAVIYGALEALLALGDWQRWRQIVGVLAKLRFDVPVERRGQERLLWHLRSWTSPAQLEEWISRDAGVDQALIRACRRLVRDFLVERAEEMAPNGLTYSGLVNALAYRDVEDFCAQVVDPMGRDAETLILDALPQQLGIGLRLWILDRREDVDLVSMDTPGPDRKIDVHVLFKPGHYDLLYSRSAGVSVAAAAARAFRALDGGTDAGAAAACGGNAAPIAAEAFGDPAPPTRPLLEALPAAHRSTGLPACAAFCRQARGSLPESAVTFPPAARSRSLALPHAPSRTMPPRRPPSLPLSLAPPQGLSRTLPVALSPMLNPASTPGLTPSLMLPPNIAPVLPHVSAPGIPCTAALRPVLCGSPIRKMHDGHGMSLQCIPVCGIPPCTQVMDGGHCDCHRTGGSTGGSEPRGNFKAEGNPKWSGVLGCGYGIIFSLSGFLQGAASPGRHLP